MNKEFGDFIISVETIVSFSIHRYTVPFAFAQQGFPMSMPFPVLSLPNWSDLVSECQRLQLGMAPSELHGGLSGWLAGGGDDPSGWMQAVLVDAGAPTPAADDPLGQLFEVTSSQLNAPDFGFSLLLPALDASLFERSEALFAWCRGFVGGYGLAAGACTQLSEEGRDALADLTRLAAEDGQAEGDEDDEMALMELEEFVRVAALLLHGEHVQAPQQRSVH